MAQVAVGLVVVGVTAICVLFDYYAYVGTYHIFDDTDFPIAVFAFLAMPFQKAFAPFGVLIAVLPVALASVSHKTENLSAKRPLNLFGNAILLFLLLSIFPSLVAMMLLNWDKSQAVIKSFTEDGTQAAAVQTAITALVSFQTVHLVQLTGLKPK